MVDGKTWILYSGGLEKSSLDVSSGEQSMSQDGKGSDSMSLDGSLLSVIPCIINGLVSSNKVSIGRVVAFMAHLFGIHAQIYYICTGGRPDKRNKSLPEGRHRTSSGTHFLHRAAFVRIMLGAKSVP